jgi:hypothetical protein
MAEASALHTGEAFMEDAAIQVAKDNLPYVRAEEAVLPRKDLIVDLFQSFEAIPKDTRYHIELRTEAYLSSPVFEVMAKHGVGQVLAHWTWLPTLRKQLAKADHRVFNSGRQRIVRLMTPHRDASRGGLCQGKSV